MKKILVTGGAGYIGSHTCVELVDAGYEPVIIDNFSNSDRSVIPSLYQLLGRDVNVYDYDCSDYDSLKSMITEEGDIYGIIHFAAFKAVGESYRNPFKYYQNNLNSTINVLEVMREFEIKNLVFSSSCTVYGQPEELPVSEESPIAEAASPYGHTKQMNEEMIREYQKLYPWIQSVVLRYFNPIGAHPSNMIGELPIGKPENLVPYITQTAAGHREDLTVFGSDYDTIDGTCVRDYIHVVDLAKAHVKSLSLIETFSDEQNNETLNLGYGKGFSVLELIIAFEKVSGLKLNYKLGERRKGDVAKIFSSSAKAEKILNWKCEYGLEEMLEHAWNWQKKLDS